MTVHYVPIGKLRPAPYNPRKWDEAGLEQLATGFKKFGICDPLICNSAPGREFIVIGGHMRLAVAKRLQYTEVPVVFVKIEDEQLERELNLRLNRNVGTWDLGLLEKFSEEFLAGVGFSSEELDEVFPIEENPEVFDLSRELKKLDIAKIDVKRGDIYEIGPDFRLMNGDSTVEADVLKLMNGEKCDLVQTDPPYILDYLRGKKRKGKATEGFGLKRDRHYLETESLPDNFTELWMSNVAKVQKPDFSIMVFENPKNLRTIWNELEKHWRYRNTIVWRLPNRVSGFAAKYKFFNKHDVALVGTSGDVALNLEDEAELFQSAYENAIFATSGSPWWEPYRKGKKYCPTDFIDFKAADEKSSGQAIIFGTKPTEILLPYLKVLTQRGDLVFEPFGGSCSTGASSLALGRRCYAMEKSSVYCEVIKRRIEKQTGLKAIKIHGQ